MSEYGSPDATEEADIFQTFAAKTNADSLGNLLDGWHLVADHSTDGTFRSQFK
jgi:hypothetical protein